jgi:hypothetical protein
MNNNKKWWKQEKLPDLLASIRGLLDQWQSEGFLD